MSVSAAEVTSSYNLAWAWAQIWHYCLKPFKQYRSPVTVTVTNEPTENLVAWATFHCDISTHAPPGNPINTICQNAYHELQPGGGHWDYTLTRVAAACFTPRGSRSLYSLRGSNSRYICFRPLIRPLSLHTCWLCLPRCPAAGKFSVWVPALLLSRASPQATSWVQFTQCSTLLMVFCLFRFNSQFHWHSHGSSVIYLHDRRVC